VDDSFHRQATDSFREGYLLQITRAIITVKKITIVSSMGLVVITVGVVLREGQSEGKNILSEVMGEAFCTYEKKKRRKNLR